MKNIQLWKFHIKFTFYFYFILVAYKGIKYYNTQYNILLNANCKKKYCSLKLIKTGFKKYGNWLRVWLKNLIVFLFYGITAFLAANSIWTESPLARRVVIESQAAKNLMINWCFSEYLGALSHIFPWITLGEKCYTWITMFYFSAIALFTALIVSFLSWFL